AAQAMTLRPDSTSLDPGTWALLRQWFLSDGHPETGLGGAADPKLNETVRAEAKIVKAKLVVPYDRTALNHKKGWGNALDRKGLERVIPALKGHNLPVPLWFKHGAQFAFVLAAFEAEQAAQAEAAKQAQAQ